MDNQNLELLITGYIQAIYFTDSGDADDGKFPLGAALAPESLAKIREDCQSFLEQAGDLIIGKCTRSGGWFTDLECAGHDFWLTRNGHGAGFWDGDWPETGERLTELAKAFGSSDTYAGDDGMVYLVNSTILN